MTLAELKPLIEAFKFQHLFIDSIGKPDPSLTLKKFNQEFKHALHAKNGEIIGKEDSDVIVRFDLVREIFLQRGL